MFRHYLIALLFALLLSLQTMGAWAQETGVGSLSIIDPWVRATIAGRPAAAYMKVRNQSEQPDRLVAVSTPAAERAELHETKMQDGVMHMRPVKALEVPAKGEVELKPGGVHIMLFGLKSPLSPGDIVNVKMQFEKSGTVDMGFKVKGMSGESMKQDMQHDMQQNDHSDQGSSD